MERYDRGTAASDRKSVEDPLLKQYADELTALYDPLAAKFPVLLDLRESMKVMAIADWLKQKGIKLSLPAAGRSNWNPPAQYPGVIHMEIAVKEAPVGEVMSASGGIDFRVDKNWKLTKQRIEEQPGPPPANGMTVDFDPASGAVASARPIQSDRDGMPLERRSAADEQKVKAAGDFQVASLTTNIFSCYRIDATKSGCLEVRNNSTRRVRLYVEGLPGVQCTVDAGSYCTVPIAVGPYHLRIVADDERGVGPTIGADVDLRSAGARLTLAGGTP
jgi:hypothetical protein